jgi:flagellar basal-body rod protein FlgF
MNSGIYPVISGNLSALKRMEVIANNLANINTLGFKKDKVSFESLLSSSTNPPVVPQSTTADPILTREVYSIDYSAGQLNHTGNSLDMAINGDGFFTVSSPEGQAYTRQGHFRLNGAKTLVTSDGYPVLGQNGGEITIRGGKVEIGHKGEIIVDGTTVDTLKIVDFQKPYNLTKTGSTLFVPADPQESPQAATSTVEIQQEYIESSNVDSIGEMVQMLDANRYFDACSKVIQNFDAITGKAANELGRV